MIKHNGRRAVRQALVWLGGLMLLSGCALTSSLPESHYRIEGMVDDRVDVPLPPGAEIEVQLVRVAKKGEGGEWLVATQTLGQTMTLPAGFELDIDASGLRRSDKLVLRAEVHDPDGVVRWATPKDQAILLDHPLVRQDLVLRPRAGGPGRNATTSVWVCDTDRIVVNAGEYAAVLSLPPAPVEVMRVPSASGVKYSDGLTTFWSKGDSAMLIRADGREDRNCKRDADAGVWEDARNRGVELRAQGKGWWVEVDRESGVAFHADSLGKIHAPYVAPERKPDLGRDTYRLPDEGGHELVLVVEGRRCTPDGGGESMPLTVTAISHDSQFKGCGTWLR